MNPKQFGAFLTEERAAKGLTQKELAEKLGVTDKAVSKWERGICLPDVSKFDDIADALDLTDLEVLRSQRLPKEPEKAPPFVTKHQLGQMLLGWVAIMGALYVWELLEIGDVVPIRALGMGLRPLSFSIFALWLALRHAQGVKHVDWHGVSVYGLVYGILFLLFVLLERSLGVFWLSDHVATVFGVNHFDQEAVFNYFYQGGIRWKPRWQFYWFLQLCYFDVWPGVALATGVSVYPIAKLLRIRYNGKHHQ